MKQLTYLILFLILLPCSLWAQQVEQIQISRTYDTVSFVDLVKEIERSNPIRFFFKKEWVDDLTVSIAAQKIPVPDLMDYLLANTKLGFVYQSPGIVFLLPEKNYLTPIPPYNSPVGEDLSPQASVTTKIEEKYLQGRQPDMIETIVVGSREKAENGKPVVVQGHLTDTESGEPLIGATMYIPSLKKGAATGSNGLMSLVLKPGVYSVVFQNMGMKQVKGNLDVRSMGDFSLSMEPQLQTIEEIVVAGDEEQTRGSKLGMESVSVKTMKELPTLMGEKDILKVAQMLPGIVSVGEGSAGVNVRGGNADQNLFYINDIPIYNSSHLFGFFSSINSGIVENFSIYKGQVPAEFGGRLSSVFNVQTRRGNKKKFFTQGGISPISANAEIETPIVEDKVSMMLSARSSYSDWILKRLDDPDLRNSRASFYDFAAALDFQLDDNDQVAVFVYNSHDQFDLNDYTDYQYGNQGGSVNYVHRFSPALKSTLSAVASNYNFSTTEKRLATESYTHAYSLDHYEIKTKWNWVPHENHQVTAGADLILYQLDRGQVNPYGNESMKLPVDLGNEKGMETAFFVDDNIAIGPRLSLNVGLRYSMFSEIGPKTVRQYLPGAAFDDINVAEINTYEKDEKIVSFQNPELRAALDFKFTRNSSMKLSVNQMTQYLFMLSNTISIAPNDQWKMVDSHINPPRSIQYSAGYFHDFPRTGLSFTGEVYYKQAKDVVEYKDGADFLTTPYVETTILQGKQEAYGAEFMLNKTTGRFNGWASYTYSRSLITVDGANNFQDINQGKTYPSNFDKPHVANLVLNYKLLRRISFSLNTFYNTGRPITLPKGVYHIEHQPFVDYSERNAYRIPDYFRMDASIKLEGNLKSKKLMHSYWQISIYNLTGRSNANSIFFTSEDGHLRGYQYSVIGVPIFTISWNWKLGNYANN
ncbi:TonB-dependent receptor [Sunxiuqinia indica]|uniref:TonB-dependent receptor n=1 Tax=Sunxiuqinia indica TaxID=2692584 RepID=UPI00135B3EF9|nr:TonB-dependent receptor plug domain-containing protein [Sunxiuqinia indica]